MESLYLRTGMYISMNLGNSDNFRTTTAMSAATNSSSKAKPTTTAVASLLSSSSFRFSFKFPLRVLWPPRTETEQRCKITASDDTAKVLIEKSEEIGFDSDGDSEMGVDHNVVDQIESVDDDENCDVCRVIDDDEKVGDDDEINFDRALFSSLLKKVSMADAKLYAKLSYLGKLTYSISKIQPENLLRYYRLRFVTSSLEKKEQLSESEKVRAEGQGREDEDLKEEEEKNIRNHINASAAYQIAASAASYLHSQTKSILPFQNSENDRQTDDVSDNNVSLNADESVELMSSEMASFMAMASTTESMTSVVGAKEDVKQAVADDLNSILSSTCDWYICDDDRTGTRYFVIQGSESLASWQANLLFEPVQFEGTDVLVHRGIYEAARGIYEHMLPEVRDHLNTHGDRSTLRFTGHSLGGSLALLVNLMLLIRGEVPASSLLPVVGFGAPYVMCGGDHLLHKLGLPKSHFQGVAMHRDIVPRAFSSLLSNHIVEIIKAVNGKFRSHPCLINQKFLFAPMGDLLILQPDDKFSPNHHLLPPGNGLYLLTKPLSDDNDAEKLVKSATKVFLNSPHPLEILSDRGAYGSEGTIVRDHDMGSYLKTIRSIIRQDLNRIRKAKREHRRTMWWPIVASSNNVNTSVVVGHEQPKIARSYSVGQRQFNFSGVVQLGRDSVKRFSRLIASQHMHLLVIMLYPARFLLFESFSASLY